MKPFLPWLLITTTVVINGFKSNFVLNPYRKISGLQRVQTRAITFPHFSQQPTEKYSVSENKAKQKKPNRFIQGLKFIFGLFSSYSYDYEALKPLAMTNAIHLSDIPKGKWIILALAKALQLSDNSAVASAITKFIPVIGSTFLANAVTSGSVEDKYSSQSRQLYLEVNKDSTKADELLEEGVISENESLFQTVDSPISMEYVGDDAYFAFLRVGGFNPLVLRLYDENSSTFPITDEVFRSVFHGDSLKAATAEKRLFIVDFKELDQLKTPGKVFTDGRMVTKCIYRPVGLFGVPKGGGDLMPIAIQGDRNSEKIVTPRTKNEKEREEWEKHKTAFNCADANYHELISHLGRTHLLIEPFVVATHNMPKNHCIRKLIMPHLEGTVFINNLAFKLLVNEGGQVDRLLFGNIDEELELSAHSVQSPGFNKLMLPTFLKERGLLAEDCALKNYPFRDDGIMLWNTTKEWVQAYVDLHYEENMNVENDLDLRKWAKILADENGGKLKGFGEIINGTVVNGSIATKSYLVDVLTMVIFTASSMHAAVNFSQRTVMSFSPISPLAGYKALDETKCWTDMLPSIEMAKEQLQVLVLLGGVYYSRLGQYKSNAFDGSEKSKSIKQALQRFQSNLFAVDNIIRRENKVRTHKYTVLMPSLIPQSINI